MVLLLSTNDLERRIGVSKQEDQITPQERTVLEKRIGAISILIKYPEWKYLDNYMTEQIQLRETRNAKRIVGQEGIDEHNFLAGEISGLNLIKKLPSAVQAKDEDDKLLEEFAKKTQTLKEEKDNGRSNTG